MRTLAVGPAATASVVAFAVGVETISNGTTNVKRAGGAVLLFAENASTNLECRRFTSALRTQGPVTAPTRIVSIQTGDFASGAEYVRSPRIVDERPSQASAVVARTPDVRT
jgi:hypothetical protein